MYSMKNAYEVDGDRVIVQVLEYKAQIFHRCLIDLADLPVVSRIAGAWYANQVRGKQMKWYALAKVWDKEAQTSRTVIMHRMILGLTDPDIEADHRDNDGLNNQRENLRPCSHRENIRFRWPDKDWEAHDRVLQRRIDQRGDRAAAKVIQERFGLTRNGMWNIRTGRTRTSPAALAYQEFIASQNPARQALI